MNVYFYKISEYGRTREKLLDPDMTDALFKITKLVTLTPEVKEGLEQFGVEWIEAEAPFQHKFGIKSPASKRLADAPVSAEDSTRVEENEQ